MSDLSVLVIDDETDIRSMLGLGLVCMGIKADVAESRDDALKNLSKQKFDVLVIDWYMPGTTMSEFLKRLKNMNQQPLVVLLSASGSIKDFAAEVGVDHYLSKPVDPFDVAEKLKTWKANSMIKN
jgi:CheY-like chemotaxis protein